MVLRSSGIVFASLSRRDVPQFVQVRGMAFGLARRVTGGYLPDPRKGRPLSQGSTMSLVFEMDYRAADK